MHLAAQPANQRSVQHGPLVLVSYITTHVDEDGVKNALIKYGVIAEN